MAKIKIEKIVDTESGEILYNKAHEIRMFLFSEEKGYMLFHNRNTIRRFPTIPWPDFTTVELGLLMRLSLLLTKDNVIEGCRTATDIGEKIGLSRTRAYRFVRKLSGHRMIAKGPQGFYFNPVFLFAGKYLTRELYLVFKTELDAYLPDWVKKSYGDV